MRHFYYSGYSNSAMRTTAIIAITIAAIPSGLVPPASPSSWLGINETIFYNSSYSNSAMRTTAIIAFTIADISSGLKPPTSSDFALGFQHFPRDLVNVNEWKIMFDPSTVKILSFWTDRSGQTAQTPISLGAVGLGSSLFAIPSAFLCCKANLLEF